MAEAQPDWELAREKNGIKVYTKFYKNEGLKQLRSEATFTGVSLHTFLAVFKDISNTPKWTARLKYSVCLKEYSETEYINYFVVDVPWPLRKREGIFRVTASQNKSDKTLSIESKVFPDYFPETDTNVRVLDCHAIWQFTPLANNQVRVQSSLYADPRGFPAWLVNMFVTDAPLETMGNLREYVKLEKYKNAKFDFIID